MSQTHHDSKADKAEAKHQADAAAEREAEAKRNAPKAKAKAPRAKARSIPAGGTIIAAGDGYSVLTAVKSDEGVLSFPPPLVVIAWSIGADGVSYPITAVPVSDHATDIGTVHTNGAVVDLDGTVYAGPAEWQAAVRGSEVASEPPVNVYAPYLSQSSDLLSCTMGIWADPPPDSYSYAWKKDGNPIGDTSAQYTIQSDDVGSTVVCSVIATNALGQTEAASNSVVVA